MAVDIPTTEPLQFVAGDTVKWIKSLADYLPADGWVLTYALVRDGSQETITATDNGDATHAVTIAAATTAAYAVGMYSWQAYATKATERYQVDAGALEVLVDFASQATGHDGRSLVKQTLDALEAVILGRASSDQLSIAIQGRSISRIAPTELLKWRDIYRAEYAAEKQRARIANGDAGGRLLTRF